MCCVGVQVGVLCRCRSLCYVGVCCVDVCVLCRFVLNHQ